MSDLSATNCGCGCDSEMSNWGGCHNNSCLFIILILLFCCGNGFSGRRGDDCGCNNSCIWIIILLLFCGNGFDGCGCGC